jgi:hypothetical protein
MYCKHCGEKVSGSSHDCSKKGLLNVDEDNSFLVSAVIGSVTDSALLGGALGGDLLGGIVGDLFDGDLFD